MAGFACCDGPNMGLFLDHAMGYEALDPALLYFTQKNYNDKIMIFNYIFHQKENLGLLKD